ncbi:MAG: hypothetical protein ACRDTT_34405, partial [Pseudonocardiaceae bacterium]
GALDHAMGQSLDVLWWKLLEGSGQEKSLKEVLEWIGERRERKPADAASGGATDPARGLQ